MELQDANFILALCDRFKKLPSEIENESTELVRLINIQKMGTPEQEEE